MYYLFFFVLTLFLSSLGNAVYGKPVSVKKNYVSQDGDTIRMRSGYVRKKTAVKRYSVSGFIYDAESREHLINATVFEPKAGTGAVTNVYGYYSLPLAEGEHEIVFSYIGYRTEVRKLRLRGDTALNIYLTPNLKLEEVVVVGSGSEAANTALTGKIDIPMKIIKAMPALLGEADVMKTIQMLPGVQGGTDGSAGLYVRGGGPDENLILLDGVPLYNVDHLLGFFSVFTPEAVKNVNFFKGSFPARFGGRLSSVVDVRTNDGNMREYHGTASIGILSAKFQTEGPIFKDRTSFNISFRRTYADILVRPFLDDDEETFGYYFYDVNAKFNHRFSDNDRIFLNFYSGTDATMSEFEEGGENFFYKDKVRMRWGNIVTALRWNHRFSPRLFGNMTAAFSRYHFKVNSFSGERREQIWSDTDVNYRSGIRDLSFNTDFDFIPHPDHALKFGTSYIYHMFKPEVLNSKYSSASAKKTDTYTSGGGNIFAHEAAVYIEDDWEISSKLQLNAGVHTSFFNVQNKYYTSFQPRLSFSYAPSGDWNLKASYSHMQQYIHLLSSYSLQMPYDLWVPSTKAVEPMHARQFVLGGYFFGWEGWEVSVETYYKRLKNVLDYKEGASFLGSSQNWDEKVIMGKGRAYGAEVMVQKKMGATTGWLAYTIAKSERYFEEVNDGKWFPHKYDRRHHVDIVVSHKFSERFDIGASWEFYTGGMATLGIGQADYIYPRLPSHHSDMPGSNGISKTDHIESRNNYRLPSTHRLNVGMNFIKKKKYGTRIWNVSVYNVYNAMNPTFLELKRRTEAQPEGRGKDRVYIQKLTLLPIIPSVSFIYKF